MKKYVTAGLLAVISIASLGPEVFAEGNGRYRFSVTTKTGEVQLSGIYDNPQDCQSALDDYVHYTPRSEYQSVSACIFHDVGQ
jgi:hypothetical protein